MKTAQQMACSVIMCGNFLALSSRYFLSQICATTPTLRVYVRTMQTLYLNGICISENCKVVLENLLIISLNILPRQINYRVTYHTNNNTNY